MAPNVAVCELRAHSVKLSSPWECGAFSNPGGAFHNQIHHRFSSLSVMSADSEYLGNCNSQGTIFAQDHITQAVKKASFVFQVSSSWCTRCVVHSFGIKLVGIKLVALFLN